ncbi:cytochrome c oxidase subunit 3 [Novosphingobium sp. 9U]|uniref:cytochrome c oxidase subunit 3 n=1 Tax=Novosphingobium sp. 9U TaxID=2653158 RepID=UPI0012EF128A|nr:cytochrome c oxidase subunit 3 [Novosphingobium sp. 9U]VWX49423.1 Cytochrome c oxidase polypeptide III [Novosphingobium sp. 9U]
MIFGRDIEIVGNLSDLPASASGPRHLVWWGNIGFMLIEGTGFALAAAAYLYVMTQASHWPLSGDQPPGLRWSTVFTIGMILSTATNWWVLRCVRCKSASGVRWGTAAMALAAAILLIPRALEFAHLHVPWHQDAYGSVMWLLLVLHTTHVVTECGESAVLATWFFTHELGDDQFADAEDNANYWTFVVLAWLPLYLLIYWAPRVA